MFLRCPVREGVQAKQWDRVCVDGEAERHHADHVHHEPRLHHVRRSHRAVTEHDRIRSRGYRQSEGVGADNACR